MGIPKFFFWTSERYPCLSELIQESQIPEFDNLYLDMNGIIHACSHPNDSNALFRISEEEIFRNIFLYLEHIFMIIKPKKVLFLSVDGVAPRAKMNQQRARRFRTAKEMLDSEKEAIKRGETLSDKNKFDSNCITPGTEFMVRLQEQLKYFMVKKVSTDALWKGVKVYLSGHQTPGEGEHKIMDFLRYLKVQPNYDPNTRHCLYGLDADLVILGMVSHEKYFSLLREEVVFGPSKKSEDKVKTPENQRFFLLHLSILRDYLEMEFARLKTAKMSFEFNIRNVIDDWVLMSLFVGNDFIPHLPGFHLNKNAYTTFFKIYIDLLPSLDGYINENGILNLPRLEKFLEKIGQYETSLFQDNVDNFGLFAESERVGQSKNGCSIANKELTPFFDEDEIVNNELLQGVEEDEEDESSSLDLDCNEFNAHKRNYYKNKLKIEPNETNLQEQSLCYVTALQWNLLYYYKGCCSWKWFYPYHYAPYVSDICNISHFNILDFGESSPAMPFEQLLGVLPIASKKFLPLSYQALMTEEKSPLNGYFPIDFSSDLNEKKQPWEAIVLIPFIEQQLLIQCANAANVSLTSDERKRNRHGPHLLFTHTQEVLPTYLSPTPAIFPDIVQNQANCIELPIDYFYVNQKILDKCIKIHEKNDEELGEDDESWTGFPRFNYLQFSFRTMNEKIRVFYSYTRNESLILRMKEEPEDVLLKKSIDHLGMPIYFNWPYLKQGLLLEVYDGEYLYKKIKNKVSKSKPDPVVAIKFLENQKQSKSHYLEKRGIYLTDTKLMLIIQPYTGMRLQADKKTEELSMVKQFSPNINLYCPVCTVVFDLNERLDPLMLEQKGLSALYPVGQKCFLLQKKYYGEMGVIEELDENAKTVTVTFVQSEEPDLQEVIDRQDEIFFDNYMSSQDLARYLKMSVKDMFRLIGTIRVSKPKHGHYNIGFGLTMMATQMEIANFSCRVNNQWFFSNKVAEYGQQYLNKYSHVLSRVWSLNQDSYKAKDLFTGPDPEAELEEMMNWLNSLPLKRASKQPMGLEALNSCIVSEIKAILDSSEFFFEESSSYRLTFALREIFVPNLENFRFAPDPKAKFELYDRVVNVRDCNLVPYGLKGVVIAKKPAEKPIDVVDPIYVIIFDKEFPAALCSSYCEQPRVFLLPSSSLLNITFGRELNGGLANSSRKNSKMTLHLPPVRSVLGQKETFQSKKHIKEGLEPKKKSYWETMKSNGNSIVASAPSTNGFNGRGIKDNEVNKPKNVASSSNESNKKIEIKKTNRVQPQVASLPYCKLLDEHSFKKYGKSPTYSIKSNGPEVTVSVRLNEQTYLDTVIKSPFQKKNVHNYVAKLFLEKLNLGTKKAPPNFLIEQNNYLDTPFQLPQIPKHWL